MVFINIEILPREADATFGFSWVTSHPEAAFTKEPVKGCTDQSTNKQAKLSCKCKSQHLFI